MLSIGEYLEINEARWARTNRIRGGKIQRRKIVATDDKFKTSGGKVKRMSAGERRKRSLSQKKGARKRRGKMKKTLRKRKITLRKRNTLGFNK